MIKKFHFTVSRIPPSYVPSQVIMSLRSCMPTGHMQTGPVDVSEQL